MKTYSTPVALCERNRKMLYSRLAKDVLVVMVSPVSPIRNGDQAFPFRQDSNFYYLSGINQPHSALILFPGSPDSAEKEILFVREPDEHIVTWEGPLPDKKWYTDHSGIDNVKSMGQFENVLFRLIKKAASVTTTFSEPESEYHPSANAVLVEKIRKKFPSVLIQSANPLLDELRQIKSREETEQVKKAVWITNQTFQKILRLVKPGIQEKAIEAEIGYEFAKAGVSAHAFAPIVASGANALALHYSQNSGICRKGDLLLLDFGAEWNLYAADVSRTIPVSGKFSPRQKKVYMEVLQMQKELKKLYKPGCSIREINRESERLLEAALIRLGLITRSMRKDKTTLGLTLKKYLPHGIAHHIGLDVHDPGDKESLLKKGMLLSCEPGIYIREESMGIRLENDILVGDFPLDLTSDIPVEPDEIEAIMHSR